MRIVVRALIAFSLAIGSSVPALAIPQHCPAGTPSPNAAIVFVCGEVGGDQFFAPLQLSSDGKTYRTPPAFEQSGGGNTPWRVGLSLTLDPDPQINYTILADNSGSSVVQSFQFTFFQAIVPEGSSAYVRGRIAGLLTDGASDGVTLTPLSTKVAVTTLSSDTVAPPTTFVNMGIDVGNPGSIEFYGPYDSGLIDGPDPGSGNLWRYMQVDVGFTLSAGDTASLSGLAYIGTVSVPEPGSLLLVGSGLLGLGMVLASRGILPR